MELRHLRYFCAAAEEMHIGRGAERLHIAQPALTIQIKALESELGVALFDRIGRGVVLTEAGHTFLRESLAVLDHVERAVALARDIGRGSAGTLRVGFTESAAFSPVVAQALAAFRLRWPAVELVLEEDLTEALVRSMELGRLDVAFVRPPVSASTGFVLESLGAEPMVVAMSRDHLMAGRETLALADLADEKFVIRKRSTALSIEVTAACHRAGFTPRVAQHAPQLSAMVNLVSASMGIAIVPECMREVRKDRVVFIPISGLDVRARLALLRRDHNLPAAQHLIEEALALRSVCRMADC